MLLSNSSIWARKSYLSVKAAVQEIYTAEQLAHTSKAKQLQVAPEHPFFLIFSPASPDLIDCCGASLLCSFGALAQPLGDIAGRQESTSSGHVWASPMWACLASVEYQKYWKALKTFVHFIHIQSIPISEHGFNKLCFGTLFGVLWVWEFSVVCDHILVSVQSHWCCWLYPCNFC